VAIENGSLLAFLLVILTVTLIIFFTIALQVIINIILLEFCICFILNPPLATPKPEVGFLSLLSRFWRHDFDGKKTFSTFEDSVIPSPLLCLSESVL
jgi:hypothetical protein